MDPRFTFGVIDRNDQLRLVLYLLTGSAVAFIVRSLRQSRDQLADGIALQERLTAAVLDRDSRLELVLAASRTGTWEWDVATGRLTWSDAIFAQHGLTPGREAPPFDDYLEMIHPDDREAFKAAIGGAVERVDRFDLEFRVQWPDGSVHWTRGAGQVFPDSSGRPVRMIGTGQDITERRRLEKERDDLRRDESRANEFRDAFIGIVSHELRTPVTTIMGSAEVLARATEPPIDARRRDLVEDIRAEAERLSRLIEDLLVLSRAERGPIEIADEPVEVRRLLGRVVAQEQMRSPETTFDVTLPERLAVVSGDQTYIEQIARNIIGNAVKYSPPGSHVAVTAEETDHEVVIRVLDEGPGIAVPEAERLFDLFYRSPEVTKQVSGSGIGLFVCARLVDAMGGRIWAHRRPEGGSEFGFSLVRIDDVDAAEAATSAVEVP
jgi:PAS domain S-box-containing protein